MCRKTADSKWVITICLFVAGAAGQRATTASAQPANDACVDAVVVIEDTPINGTTTGATGTDITSCTSNDSLDVWYVYTPAQSGTVIISLCGSTYDTALAVFDVCGGTESACNDDSCGLQSEVTLAATLGHSVMIRVSGFGGTSGDFTLSVTLATGGGGNDFCANATVITDGMHTGSTIGATNDGAGTCGTSATSPDVWFEYVAPLDGILTVSTCGAASYDTVLGVWLACPPGGGETACNDDACSVQSTVLMAVTVGTTYWIRVSGFNGATGTFTLDVQTVEAGNTTGPDVLYSEIQNITHWGAVGGIHAYSLSSHTCNIGDQNLQWGGVTPLLAMNAYRLYQGRLEQIGMSWVKNGTSAAAGTGCGLPCNGQGGPVLGAGCRDIYSSNFNGTHSILGPRSSVNPFTGAYPGPSGGSGNAIFKRLQIHEADLAQTDALYFVDGQYVAPDDAAAGNAMNNASYKRVTVDGAFNLTPVGAADVAVPAIFAWRDHGNGVGIPDNTIQVVSVDVPNEGRFHVAARVVPAGVGVWHYEYAVRNFNSDRACSAFTVPLPPGALVTNVGFHDVDYHSGEPYDNTDWGHVIDAAGVTWSSPDPTDPNTNALRWATLYNFWFDADVAPVDGTVTLGLFKAVAGQPDIVNATVMVPGGQATVPTVSQWGLVAMTLLLLTAGTIIARSKRTAEV